jgi:hypothetical protein
MEVFLPLGFLLAIWLIVILGSGHFNKNIV